MNWLYSRLTTRRVLFVETMSQCLIMLTEWQRALRFIRIIRDADKEILQACHRTLNNRQPVADFLSTFHATVPDAGLASQASTNHRHIQWCLVIVRRRDAGVWVGRVPWTEVHGYHRKVARRLPVAGSLQYQPPPRGQACRTCSRSVVFKIFPVALRGNAGRNTTRLGTL